MFNSFDELMTYLKGLRNNDYQRDNFDHFLKKTKFHYDVPSIHIAGTNGKGTTGTILNEIYVNQGLKVGYYRSPYFVYPNETITINNEPISLDYFNKIIAKYQKELKKFDLSQFELETFVALSYFNENNCDIAIIECGMGGETDATNIFTPILSIITSIDLEHTNFLGSSITEIAYEKAGIIKDEVPVVVGDLNKDALDVIIEVSKETESTVLKVQDFYNEKIVDGHYQFDFKPFEKLELNSLAYYSLKDAGIALTAIHLLSSNFDVSEEVIRKGLKSFNLKGRMNVINENPLLIIDGAHNPHGIKALRESLEKLNDKELPIHVVFAAFKDKNIDSMLAELSFISKDITLTTFDHERARTKEEYFLYLSEYNYMENPFEIINQKLSEFPNDMIVICGSLAFAGYVINHQDLLVYPNSNINIIKEGDDISND